MQKNLLFGVIGIVLGTVLTWTFLRNVNVSNSVRPESTSNQQVNQSNATTIDAHFIEQMIPHHEDAITMAKLAQTKAKRSEVKELANNIIAAQTTEIDQMKKWYKEWFGRDLPTGSNVMNQHGMMGNSTGMHMGMMGGEMDLERLENAQDFDQAFVEDMIPHHQMAVMMASMLKNGTQREEMKKLADNIINSQTAEINTMRGWLVDWSK